MGRSPTRRSQRHAQVSFWAIKRAPPGDVFELPKSAQRTPQDFTVMVVDGASAHVAKALAVPENIHPALLPTLGTPRKQNPHADQVDVSNYGSNRPISPFAFASDTLARCAAEPDRKPT